MFAGLYSFHRRHGWGLVLTTPVSRGSQSDRPDECQSVGLEIPDLSQQRRLQPCDMTCYIKDILALYSSQGYQHSLSRSHWEHLDGVCLIIDFFNACQIIDLCIRLLTCVVCYWHVCQSIDVNWHDIYVIYFYTHMYML